MRGCPQVRHTEFSAGPPSPEGQAPTHVGAGEEGSEKTSSQGHSGLASLWGGRGGGQGQSLRDLQALLSPCSLRFLLP